MADEYTDYLDPDYSSEVGNVVDIYIKESIGTVFSTIFTESVVDATANLTLLAGTTGFGDLALTWTIDSFSLSISLPS
ncbi:hypothetical protein LCGC14_1980450 [marine sediment metagenome]|uniref:Uncharacterized protein n=1 Tax=marine sediment metagenome TaxID=412755 RepID=A0A0F9F9C5_9ZZZZ